jgi:ketosteroid isomerase-like protein
LRVDPRRVRAWNRDDLDAWLETLHPDVEFHTSGLFPDFDSVYRGHMGVAEFWRWLHEPWEEFHVDIEQIVAEGDCFSVTGRLRAKGVDSGVAVDMRFAHSLCVRDGLLAQIVVRRTVEEAREDLHRMQPAARSKHEASEGQSRRRYSAAGAWIGSARSAGGSAIASETPADTSPFAREGDRADHWATAAGSHHCP